MPPIKIISATERLAEQRGAKVLLMGPTGVGKTSQLRTLDPETTLFVDIEAGDLAVLDLPVPTIRVPDWPMARDLAVKVVGPNPSFPATASYSSAHYDGVGRALENLERVETIFIDSLTAASMLSFRWAEQQPEAFSDRTGKRDLRGAYGLHGRETLLWLNHWQHARAVNVIFVGIAEYAVDDFKVGTWQLQAEGQRLGRELPGIVDQIISYQFLDFGDGKPPRRGFVCTNPNPWGYPAKDRSGRLDQVEPPNLGALLRKLTAKNGDRP
jgi:hypothetical protein